MITTNIMSLRDFFDIFGEYYKTPSDVFDTPWFNDFFTHLDDCFSRDDSFSENMYEDYFNMGLPKSKDYLSYFDAFETFLMDIGLDDYDWDGDIFQSSRIFFSSAPWESWGYDRLKSTNDYFWFLVLFLQRMGSLSEYESTKFKNTLKTIYNKGLTKYFDIKWFEPLNNWINSKRMMDEFNSSKVSVKSFDIPPYLMSGFEPDDVSSVPEYEIDDSYFSLNGNFYHKDKIILAITASGGFAQALERQDLEPRVTNVSSLIGKRKRRKK